MIDDLTAQRMAMMGRDVPSEYLASSKPSFLQRLFCLHEWEYVKYMDRVDMEAGFMHTGDGYLCKKCNAEKR